MLTGISAGVGDHLCLLTLLTVKLLIFFYSRGQQKVTCRFLKTLVILYSNCGFYDWAISRLNHVV